MNFLGSFLSPQGIATLAFLMVVAMTIVGALIAVAARNIFHNVLGLALSLIGVAGLFLYLNSPFVALMEFLI
jgi:NADH-quinone oxidoreductase subunit J